MISAFGAGGTDTPFSPADLAAFGAIASLGRSHDVLLGPNSMALSALAPFAACHDVPIWRSFGIAPVEAASGSFDPWIGPADTLLNGFITIPLMPGTLYDIELHYYEHSGGASCRLQ